MTTKRKRALSLLYDPSGSRSKEATRPPQRGTSKEGRQQAVTLEGTSTLHIRGCAQVTVEQGALQCWSAALPASEQPYTLAGSSACSTVAAQPLHCPNASGSLAVSPQATLHVSLVGDGSAVYVSHDDGGTSSWSDESCCPQEWEQARLPLSLMLCRAVIAPSAGAEA